LLAVGGEATAIAARAGKAKAVLSASDASDRALRQARHCSQAGGAVYTVVPYTMAELGHMTGRGSPGTVAILDMGLAAKFIEGLAASDPELYRKAAGHLTEKARPRAKKKHTKPPGSGAPHRLRRTEQ
jgi:ribosomal protein L30E